MPDIGDSGRFPALDVAAYERSLAQPSQSSQTPSPAMSGAAAMAQPIAATAVSEAETPSVHDTQPIRALPEVAVADVAPAAPVVATPAPVVVPVEAPIEEPAVVDSATVAPAPAAAAPASGPTA